MTWPSELQDCFARKEYGFGCGHGFLDRDADRCACGQWAVPWSTRARALGRGRVSSVLQARGWPGTGCHLTPSYSSFCRAAALGKHHHPHLINQCDTIPPSSPAAGATLRHAAKAPLERRLWTQPVLPREKRTALPYLCVHAQGGGLCSRALLRPCRRIRRWRVSKPTALAVEATTARNPCLLLLVCTLPNLSLQLYTRSPRALAY